MSIQRLKELSEVLYRQQRAERLLSLVGETLVATLVIDSQSRIKAASPAIERLLGWKPDELTGQFLPQTLIPVELRDRHLASFARYRETAKHNIDWSGVNLPALHREGHEVPVRISFSEFVDNGEAYWVGIMQAMSDANGD